jgi:DHA3 family macrolide efflux protein-like MFS transporter
MANAAISANLIIGFAVGPALGGILVAFADERWALLAASAVMVLDVALVASIREPGVCRASAAPGASLGTLLREGLTSVRAYAVLWQGLAVIAFIMFAVGGGAVGLVVLGDEGLGMGDGGFSVLLSALGAGTFAGALAIGGRRPESPKGTLVVVAPLLAGVLLIALPFAPSVAVALLVMVALGAACAMVLVPFTTMLQERMGDHIMGTSFGVLNTALTTPMVVGVAVAGPVLDALGTSDLFVAMGVLLISVGIVAIVLTELWGEG